MVGLCVGQAKWYLRSLKALGEEGDGYTSRRNGDNIGFVLLEAVVIILVELAQNVGYF